MDSHMKHRRSSKRKFRSQALPPELTHQFCEKILSLRSSVKTDYLKEEFLSKFVSDDTDPADVRRQRAINKWLAAERDNEATCERLLLTSGEYNLLPRVSFARFVGWCQREVADILGDTVPIEALIGTFSGGASTSRSRAYSQPANKYVGKAHATPEAHQIFFDYIIEECPGWFFSGIGQPLEIVEVPGNAMFTVPKKTDIDRVACKEPDLNMFIQKGLGDHIRRSLKRVGINLNDQSINRSLALRGSVDGSLATLDLSSASDSVTTELVRLLLPETWFTFLDSVRSRVTIIDGEEHRNWMFSSMGNGFTFELESLLFYVLMRATAYFRGIPGIISVYGDDLIIPTELVYYASWVLNWFGFQVNPDKSHSEGPFRESCGGHYWNGLDITPFYLRRPISTLPDLIHVANSLREWGADKLQLSLLSEVIDPDIEEIWLWLKSYIPKILWGGGDTSFKYQLVSNDEPSHRLLPESVRRDAGLGGYLHWLHATWNRTGEIDDPIATSRYTVNHSCPNLRVKPVLVKTVPRLPALFVHELCGVPVTNDRKVG